MASRRRPLAPAEPAASPADPTAAAAQAAKPARSPKPGEPAKSAKAAKPAKPAKKPAQAAPASVWKRVARPDAIDFRDRVYQPSVATVPPLSLMPEPGLPVENQGETNACTGFALATVVNQLLRRAGREAKPRVAPFMLYSMARRYDEFPGSVADEGSSARGALKGWFRHGVCRQALFNGLEPPATPLEHKEDWWLDAVRRPLGAYYRLDPKDLPDMHAALAETGALFVTAGCHAGWDELVSDQALAPAKRLQDLPLIERKPGSAAHGGHAFAILGYDARGFIIQNSWGPTWGRHGQAVMSYEDWLENGWDCWVAQLGVVTHTHEALAGTGSLRLAAGPAGQARVTLARDPVLRDRELSPYILNMGNNGDLSNSGSFRTLPGDVEALMSVQLALARKAWGLSDEAPLDVCLYAHGGLVDEAAAAEIAARWIPALYARRILPIFLMWETGFLDTLGHRIEDALKGRERSASRGLGESFERIWNRRLEQALARPGTALWGEMKQNAEAMSQVRRDATGQDKPLAEQAGLVQLWRHYQQAAGGQKLRLHLVGHSAGSIVASHMAAHLAGAGVPIESISFMAPAIRADAFRELLAPLLMSGAVRRFQTFHLDERTEEADSVGPYRRSLLYLLRESFEGGSTVPIAGLAIDWQAQLAPALQGAQAEVRVHSAPGETSRSLSHGGFDEDPPTMAGVLDFIRPDAG